MSRGVKTVGIHFLGWILFFSLIVGFVNSFPEVFSLSFLLEPSFLLFFFGYLFLFYLNAYVLIPQFYLKRQYVLYTGVILLLFLGVYLLQPYDHLMRLHMHSFEGRENFLSNHQPPSFDSQPHAHGPRHGDRPRKFDLVSVVLFLTVWSFSTALQIMRQWRFTERRALQAEADKVNAELSFLKAQVNPHFLFNTLNNIYSLSIAKNEKTPDAILKLSGILRYITDDVRNDFVPLRNEVECVENYIALQKLRLTSKVDVMFSVQGELDAKQIAPLLFMTFIENAFKYGISSHEACTISIEIIAQQQAIDFFCQNKIMVKNVADERTGVGISNAKKRLEYLYPEKYLLNIHTENNHFSVHLTIRS